MTIRVVVRKQLCTVGTRQCGTAAAAAVSPAASASVEYVTRADMEVVRASLSGLDEQLSARQETISCKVNSLRKRLRVTQQESLDATLLLKSRVGTLYTLVGSVVNRLAVLGAYCGAAPGSSFDSSECDYDYDGGWFCPAARRLAHRRLAHRRSRLP